MTLVLWYLLSTTHSNYQVLTNKFKELPYVGNWGRRPLELATLRWHTLLHILPIIPIHPNRKPVVHHAILSPIHILSYTPCSFHTIIHPVLFLLIHTLSCIPSLLRSFHTCSVRLQNMLGISLKEWNSLKPTQVTNTPCQYTLSIYSINTPCQHVPYQHTLSIHSINHLIFNQHTLSTTYQHIP